MICFLIIFLWKSKNNYFNIIVYKGDEEGKMDLVGILLIVVIGCLDLCCIFFFCYNIKYWVLEYMWN